MSPCVAEGFVIYILHTRLIVYPGQRYTNSFLHVENQFIPHLALRVFFFFFILLLKVVRRKWLLKSLPIAEDFFSVDYCLNCANTKHLECDRGVMGEKVLPKEHFHLVSFEQYFYHILFQLSKGIWNNVLCSSFTCFLPSHPAITSDAWVDWKVKSTFLNTPEFGENLSKS